MNQAPASIIDPPGSRAPAPDALRRPEGIKVLALDDASMDILALERCLGALRGMPTCLTGCTTVELALAAVRQGPFDLLFVDYAMGAITGLEALSRLRDEGCWTPAILLTGNAGEKVLHEALRAGVVDYVSKARLDPDLIGQIVRNVLEKVELNARIDRSQEELKRTVDCLEQRREEIESFYHNVSHELKTPLTGAREFVSLVHDGVAGEVNANQIKLLGAAIRNCDQIVHCVNDLLDASRMETGKLVLQYKSTNFVTVLMDAVESVRARAEEQGITMSVAGVAEPLEMTFDPHRMYQVVANLVSNALKFTPQGGSINVAVDPSVDRSLSVTVTDTGPGVSKGDELRVFDRLYQSRAEDAAVLGGLGMGLYICREIMELHDGTISYEHGPAGGAQFTVILPRAPASMIETPHLSKIPLP